MHNVAPTIDSYPEAKAFTTTFDQLSPESIEAFLDYLDLTFHSASRRRTDFELAENLTPIIEEARVHTFAHTGQYPSLSDDLVNLVKIYFYHMINDHYVAGSLCS